MQDGSAVVERIVRARYEWRDGDHTEVKGQRLRYYDGNTTEETTHESTPRAIARSHAASRHSTPSTLISPARAQHPAVASLPTLDPCTDGVCVRAGGGVDARGLIEDLALVRDAYAEVRRRR